jgi:CPA1 family monovalent cation:H+ antiporter
VKVGNLDLEEIESWAREAAKKNVRVTYRLAVAATVGTATFTPAAAGMQGVAMVASIAAGFVLAHLTMRLIRLITDIPSAIVLQFVTTFGVWILAEEIGLSASVEGS